MPRPRIFHYHIFKNAGTSVEKLLLENFAGKFSAFDGIDPSSCLPAEETLAHVLAHPEVIAFSSHQAKLPPPRVEGSDFLSLIFIRHPIDRAASIYSFEKRRLLPGLETSARAGDLSFREYVEWFLDEKPTRNLFDFQTLYCSSKTDYYKTLVTSADFEEAEDRLREIAMVGVVDLFDESMELFATTLRGMFPGIAFRGERENASEGRKLTLAERLEDIERDLGPALHQRLCECNQFDMALYDSARALLNQRLSKVIGSPSGF